MKKRVFVDMDNTLVDFNGGMSSVPKEISDKLPYNYEWDMPAYDWLEGYFRGLKPNKGGVETIRALEASGLYDVYILTAVPWENPSAAKEKLEWIREYFGPGKDGLLYKKVLMCHHKDFIKGDILIDDRMDKNGAGGFEGEKIEYNTDRFPDWAAVRAYLLGND